MRFVAVIIWVSGIIGWNAAGSERGDMFTPMALIWPAVLAYDATHEFYEDRYPTPPRTNRDSEGEE